MDNFSIAFKNVKNNVSFYALYLFSVSLVITIFFAFSSFKKNHAMLEKISADGRVETMCSTISVFLMIFVLFYMSYSNRFFLKRRTKELGIYALLGYRKSKIILLLTFENFFVCVGAFVTGIGMGAVLHKSIVVGITALLRLSVDGAKIQLFNWNAVTETACFILLIVFVLAFSNGRFLFKTTLIDLVRFEKKAEKKLKIHLIPAIFGFAVTICGYGLCLDILRGAKSVWITIGFFQMGMLAMLLVVTGTVFLILAFVPYIIEKSKKNKRIFYTEVNIIKTPSFIYHIRSNAKTLILLTLLSAATLTISSVMALTLYYPIAAVSRMAPSEIEFRMEDENQVNNVKQLVRRYSDDSDVVFTQTDIFKVPSSASRLPMEYSLGTSKGDAENEKLLRNKGFECISHAQYLSLLKAQGKQDIKNKFAILQENECILVKYQPNESKQSERGIVYPLHIGNKTLSLKVVATTLHNPIAFANSVGTLVVSNQVYEKIKQHATPETRVISINGKAVRNNELLYQEISNLLGASPYLQSNSHRANEILAWNSSTFLLIGFLVVLFFIATGSILYFLNTSAIADAKADYGILSKIGYSDATQRKIVKTQVSALFGIPFIFGLVDCGFATLVYKNGLMQNMLGNSFVLFVPAFIALVIAALIYVVYYLLTIHSCYRSIREVKR